MADPRSAGLFASLRAAARTSQDRFLVGVRAEKERRRIVAALSAEGVVVEAESLEQGLARLKDEPFEIVVFAWDEVKGDIDPLAQAKADRPLSDVIVFCSGDPHQACDLMARDVAAVLPDPLPQSDAVLRAHLRWLASCRRSRARGTLLKNALVRHNDELLTLEPALARVLSEIAVDTDRAPSVMVSGDAELVSAVAGRAAESNPDVVVVGVAATDNPTARMQEARGRAAGAALIVVDAALSPERLSSILYGGARACLSRSRMAQVAQVVSSIAVRRQAEVSGRRLIEALARFGVLDDAARLGPAPPSDLDARLIAGATTQGSAFVPSGHEVLVVDDEVVVLTVLREALRRGGYRVTTAASAEEAIELLHKRCFDLVLTDKNLPGASGLDVLRAARVLDPAPAVVLITGYSSYDSAVEAMEIGAHDYIEKPIRDVETLRYRIRRALSRRDEQMARARKPVQENEGSPRGRVLVVELDGSRRQLIADYLGRVHDVTAAANGDEALEFLKKQRYDVVLADRNLPGMSGLRVIEQAQQLLPHCASVLYTAYPSYESVKEAFDLGVDAYLVRPSEDLKKLAEKVAGALRSRGGILLG